MGLLRLRCNAPTSGGVVQATASDVARAGDSSASALAGAGGFGFDPAAAGLTSTYTLNYTLSGAAVGPIDFFFAYAQRTDATAPISPPNVVAHVYDGNSDLGGGFVAEGPGGNAWRRMYTRYWVWFSPNYVIHTTGEKDFYPLRALGAGEEACFLFEPWARDGSSGGAIGYQLGPQAGIDDTFRRPLVAANVVPRGVWTQIELYVVANTPGAANGVARWWINGTLAGDYTNIAFHPAGSPGVWRRWRRTGYRGGPAANPTPPEGQERRYDHELFWTSTTL